MLLGISLDFDPDWEGSLAMFGGGKVCALCSYTGGLMVFDKRVGNEHV